LENGHVGLTNELSDFTWVSHILVEEWTGESAEAHPYGVHRGQPTNGRLPQLQQTALGGVTHGEHPHELTLQT
jgi:hypothetical protein